MSEKLIGIFCTVYTAAYARAISIVLAAIVCIVTALPVYYLWNWLLPVIFGIKAITFFQAWGISLFASTLLSKSNSVSFNKV